MQQLADLGRRRQLLAPSPLPLFRATVRNGETKEEVRLAADAGWSNVETATDENGTLTLRWQKPTDQRLAGVDAVRSAFDPGLGTAGKRPRRTV